MAHSVSCSNQADTSAFVGCKNRKKTYGCFRHYISDKQAHIREEKTKGCFLLKTEGAFLILVLFLLNKASWLYYFIEILTCDVAETNAVWWDQNPVCPKPANSGSEKMWITVTSVSFSLCGCCIETSEHILDGTSYTYLIPWDTAWSKKKGHIAQARIKLLRWQHQSLTFVLQLFCLVRRKSLKQRKTKTAFFYKSTLHTDFNLTSFPHVIRVHRVCASACYQGVISEVLRVFGLWQGESSSGDSSQQARSAGEGVKTGQDRRYTWVPCFSQQWNFLSF